MKPDPLATGAGTELSDIQLSALFPVLYKYYDNNPVGTAVLKNNGPMPAENIQVQFHNIAVESARRMERIQKAMEITHQPTYQYKFVWENWVLKR